MSATQRFYKALKPLSFCCEEDTEACDPVVTVENAVALLKAERARVRRMVRTLRGTIAYRGTLGDMAEKAYREACDDILAKLKEGK